MTGVVVGLAQDGEHRFSKVPVQTALLVAGLGVDGDAHAGTTVQHRSRVRRDPRQPNLRQVHLIHAELLEEVNHEGFDVHPGTLGENILTRGLDLLRMPRGTILAIGSARIEITGLRNPCQQIEEARPGLLRRVVYRDRDGQVVRRCGVMGIVLDGGQITVGDRITVALPEGEQQPLEPV